MSINPVLRNLKAQATVNALVILPVPTAANALDSIACIDIAVIVKSQRLARALDHLAEDSQIGPSVKIKVTLTNITFAGEVGESQQFAVINADWLIESVHDQVTCVTVMKP